jgi:hypothetical protein
MLQPLLGPLPLLCCLEFSLLIQARSHICTHLLFLSMR